MKAAVKTKEQAIQLLENEGFYNVNKVRSHCACGETIGVAGTNDKGEVGVITICDACGIDTKEECFSISEILEIF